MVGGVVGWWQEDGRVWPGSGAAGELLRSCWGSYLIATGIAIGAS